MAPRGEDKLYASALRHAYDIEDKKKLQAQIADLVVQCFDLPSNDTRPNPEHPAPTSPHASDVKAFKYALTLFQPGDFDDLVYERNVDDRCGYALCAKPNRKLSAGERVWNGKGGKDFEIVPRAELEKWCSEECGVKAAFARSQLRSDPAWVREGQGTSIWLSDEMDDGTSKLTTHPSDGSDVVNRLKTLSLDRGEPASGGDPEVQVVERLKRASIQEAPELGREDAIEGFRPRKVRFADSPEA